ncbi:MAG: hypothetical protein QM809_10930 [Gordonia sp. (in: high G+C Gram-positive bacteria)]|uniref:hypothetical protein n=1 Tax=Gordonia sp. (in: high G+C Gram-positive bacteria) TaxID=84139 RepID=UPI0039E4B0BF
MRRMITVGLFATTSLLLASCGGERPAPGVPSIGVTTVTTESREGIDAAVKVCRQAITSAGVMVRDYNVFVSALNRAHSYAALNTEARYARDTLNTGAEEIRKALTPALPEDVEQKVQSFLTATEQLSEQIAKRRKLALNKTADEWSDERTELIDACGEFMPTGTT